MLKIIIGKINVDHKDSNKKLNNYENVLHKY